MTELGLMCGDPDAASSWDREQRARAMAWWLVRTSGEPVASTAPVSRRDLRGLVDQFLGELPGLRNFVARGLVALGGKARG